MFQRLVLLALLRSFVEKKKAKDLVEKHAAAKNKAASINWKNRAVEVDGKDVFTQDKNDTAGKFMQPFMDINLE